MASDHVDRCFFVDFCLKKTKVQLDSDGFWHLGGFCFGHNPEDREVGLLKGTLQWAGQVPLHKAQVYVAGLKKMKKLWGEGEFRARWGCWSDTVDG